MLKYAGASLHRDALDEIMISDARNGEATFTGSGNRYGFINSQEDVKSRIPTMWPELKQGEVLKDTDGDGMPDEWEDQHGLNKNNKADGNAKGQGGYTNLEIYLNSLVTHITEAQNEGGEVMGEKLPSETTGIVNVNDNDNGNGNVNDNDNGNGNGIFNRNDGAYYTLQGLRTATPTRGIYIHIGKKIIVD